MYRKLTACHSIHCTKLAPERQVAHSDIDGCIGQRPWAASFDPARWLHQFCRFPPYIWWSSPQSWCRFLLVCSLLSYGTSASHRHAARTNADAATLENALLHAISWPCSHGNRDDSGQCFCYTPTANELTQSCDWTWCLDISFTSHP